MYIPYTEPKTQVLHGGQVVLRDQLNTRYGREAIFAKQLTEKKSVEWVAAVVLGTVVAHVVALMAG
jgi:hypothetical protein